MLYQVAVMEKPTKKARDNGKLERLVVEPTFIVANDPQSAAISVFRKNDIEVDENRMEILVRPFA